MIYTIVDLASLCYDNLLTTYKYGDRKVQPSHAELENMTVSVYFCTKLLSIS